MKTIVFLFGIISFSGFLHGCTEDPIPKTKDFTPEVLDYEFYIEGDVDNKLLRYKQINYDWDNTSNKYFIDHKETWLQAYSDSIADPGYWYIRISDLDITNIELPYTLKEFEGNISWYDQRIDALIENNSNCQRIDGYCTFVLRSGENSITLTSNKDNVIEGVFSGRALLYRIGFQPYNDESRFHDIINGKFRIKYREE